MPRTILITGATDGLGRLVARRLAEAGERVIVHGRDEAKAEETVAEIGGEGTRHVIADLSTLEGVRGLAAQILDEEPRLDVLVNNAGLGAGPEEREVSPDGLELRFQVNYLAPFLLTHLLLPLLERSAPARIVNIASVGQAPLDFDDPQLERSYDGMRAYFQSKLAQVTFTFELAERLGEGSGVTVNALHPASLMDTKMVREGFGAPRSSVEEGAAAVERLVMGREFDRLTGLYFDGQREARADRQAYDPDARRRLWDLSERLAGVHA